MVKLKMIGKIFEKYLYLKSVLISSTLIILGVKNIENRLRAFYDRYDFKGAIHIKTLKVNYIYSEKVNGKQEDIPIQINMPWSNFFLPPLGLETNHLGKEKYNQSFDESSILTYSSNNRIEPIVYKAVELNGAKENKEKYFTWLFKKNPTFSVAKIEIELQQSKNKNNDKLYSELDEKILENRKNGQDQLGGAYGLTMEDALSARFYHIKITLPNQIPDSLEERYKDALRKVLYERNWADAVYDYGNSRFSFRAEDLMRKGGKD